MRMLILLIALAVVGLLLAKQLTAPEETPASAEAAVPDVPSRPQELDDFERDMDRFMRESAAARRESVDEEAR